MRRKFPWWSLIGLVLVLVGIAGYNYWAYNCGFCAIQDMKTIGPQAKAVGYLVLGSAACWFGLTLSRIFKKPSPTCLCGRNIIAIWSFCPDCGHPIK